MGRRRGTGMGSMAGVFALVLCCHSIWAVVAADNGTTPTPPGGPYDIPARFNPSMAIIIIVLISAFLFMGFFSVYVRRCTSGEPEAANTNVPANGRPAAENPNRPSQGLDKAVVETLPLVGFSLIKGLKGGKDLSECAVCLSEFEGDETLRLLPKCGHLFHPDCIDMWFFSHATCPLCRASLIPGDGKDGSSEGFANWVRVDSRGNVSDGLAITIHDGPPAPPNGSILELLSREDAERLMTESLRRDGVERVDAGLASREENVGEGRAVELRALNRALSRNSTSFRKAARGIEATERIGASSDSARFNPSTVAGLVNGVGSTAYLDKRRNNRSVGSSQSFNTMILRRSNSMGSSGRYFRQLLGQNYADYFSPETAGDGLRVDRAKLLAEHRMPPKESTKVKRERSENELHNIYFNELQNMTYMGTSNNSRSGEMLWDSIDLQNESMRAAQQAAAQEQQQRPRPRSMELPFWQRSLDFPSFGKGGELPPLSRNGDKRVRLQGEASGPLYIRRKGNANGNSNSNGGGGGGDGARSDRWNFNIRRTFSLRRTFSDSADQLENVSSSQNGSSRWYLPGPGVPTPPSRPKKFSPWAGAMKDRRSQSGEQSSPSSASTVFSPYALSLPSPSSSTQAFSRNHSSNLSSPGAPSPSSSQQASQPSSSQERAQEGSSEPPIQIITQ